MKRENKRKVKKVRSNVTYTPEDFEWLRLAAFQNRTQMSKIIRYMIHYFRDNKIQTKFPV